MTIVTLGMIDFNSASKRPFINVAANGSCSPWLFDTGAEVCCMNISEFRKIDVNKRPIKINTQKELRCASSKRLTVKGTYLMNITILGREIQQIVYVCENLGQPAILGIDAIEKLGLIYSAKQKRFYFETENWNFKTGKMFALSAHSVAPLSVQPIRVSALEATGFRPPAGITAVATVHAPNAPLLSGGPGLVVTNQLGEVTILLQNCSPNTIDIARGDVLGSIECIQGKHIEQVRIEEIAQAFEKVPNIKVGQLSEQRKRDMLNDIVLNVPANERQIYLKLILENHDVFSKDKNDLGLANHYRHSITLKNTEPLYIKQFKIPEVHRKMLEVQVKEWLKLGIIQRSNSKYNSPVFVVPKKEPGQFRFVQDFRKLNQNSLDDKYCMKDVSECIGEIGRAGSTIFSTLDLTSGFWQMPLDKASREYTAFTIPGMGQFEWLVSAMGLKSCPAAFQRLVELAMRGLDNVIVYIDDLILHSHDHVTHRKELLQLFERLRKTGLKVNLKKCHFGSNNVNYLGFRLTPNGILPGIDKLQAVRESTPPTNVHQVRSFLGLCNFFRSHVKNFSRIATPLNQLTRKDCAWRGGKLNEDALKAFNELKSSLCSEPVVAYPRKDRPYSLIVDAATGNGTSEGGVGAILCQQDAKEKYCVIAYASRALIKHEKNYTPFLLEMMAAVWAMEHFDTYLRGRKFTLFTDHRPLEKLATVHKKTLNRLQEAMLEYDFKIVYKNGSEMPADFLSRNILASIDVFDDDLPRLQAEDYFIKTVSDYMHHQKLPTNKKQAAHVQIVGKECFLDNGIIWRRLTRYDEQARSVLLLPQVLANDIVQEAHGQILTGHDGIAKTKERILQSYYWPNIDKDVTLHIRSCQRCQTRRVDHRPKPHLLTPLPQCSEMNQRVHVDLYGPLKTSESGKKFILVMTDAFSKYAEVTAVHNKEATTVGEAIFNRWICRFGCPLEVVSDGGKEFVNKLSKELYSKLNIKHSMTTAYHPQCNAQVERFNQTVSKYLASFTDQSTLDWELYLAPLAFSYNTSLHRTTRATPFALTFGQEARLPSFPNPDIQRQYGESPPAEWMQRLQYGRQLAAQQSMRASQTMEQNYNKKAEQTNYQVGQLILLKEENFLHKNRKLASQWSGPYKIVKVMQFGVVDIEYKNKIYRVNVARIKPFFAQNIPLPQTMQQPPLTQQQQQQRVIEENRNDENEDTNENENENIQTEETNEQTEQQTPPQQTAQKRGRGRPRKMAVAPSQQAQSQPADILQENQPDTPTALMERRITRSMTSNVQPQPTEQGVGEIQMLPTHQLSLQRRETVGMGPIYICRPVKLPNHLTDYGLDSLKTYNKKNWKKLTIAKRNIRQTGDPGFSFDPIVYEYPWQRQNFQQQQLQQIVPYVDSDESDDDDRHQAEDAAGDGSGIPLSETELTDSDNLNTSTATEDEQADNTEPERRAQPPRQATSLPIGGARPKIPQPQLSLRPTGAQIWRSPHKLPRKTSSDSWYSSWLPDFFQGGGNVWTSARSVPHPPGSRPRPYTAHSTSLPTRQQQQQQQQPRMQPHREDDEQEEEDRPLRRSTRERRPPKKWNQ